MHLYMRDMQVRCINDPVIVQKDVQIQCARSPMDQALPMGFLLSHSPAASIP